MNSKRSVRTSRAGQALSSVVHRVRPYIPGLGRALGLYVASRVVVTATLIASTLLSSALRPVVATPGTGVSAPPRVPITHKLNMWDGAWYTAISIRGYPPVNPHRASFDFQNVSAHPAFFPLYPATLRAARSVTGIRPGLIGALVSTGFGAIATLLLWLVARRTADESCADRAAALFAFFPGAFVFSIAYSEALMLTLSMACLLFLLDRRWILAGAAAALATATRPNAVVLVLCCGWAAAVAIARDREWKALVAPVLAPLGTISFFVFLWQRTGEPFAWFITQRTAWQEKTDFGVRTVHTALRVLGGR